MISRSSEGFMPWCLPNSSQAEAAVGREVFFLFIFFLSQRTWGGTSGPTRFVCSQLSLCGQSKCRQAGWLGRWQTGSLSRHQIECFWLEEWENRLKAVLCLIQSKKAEGEEQGGPGRQDKNQLTGRDISPVWADVWGPQSVAAVEQHSLFSTPSWWE